MQVAPSEVSRHDALVLARLLVAAVEAFSVRTGESYASIGRRAGLARGYVDKMRAAVAEDPEHRIDTSTLEKLAAAVGYKVTLVPMTTAAEEYPTDTCGPCRNGRHQRCYAPCLCADRNHAPKGGAS